MKLGVTEWLIILAIVLILFGPSQIPKLKRMFKGSKKGFQDGVNSSDDDVV